MYRGPTSFPARLQSAVSHDIPQDPRCNLLSYNNPEGDRDWLDGHHQGKAGSMFYDSSTAGLAYSIATRTN